ncbi:glycoside hydrolase family 16 protein [Rhodopirellula sp. P2]|uniref:glycoside hydrolase family 16 protein n=1 Tax=Rhodopirellula sp. P2 TaxID=2127060 RepID=UPI0023685B1D|nr:glycoside hydrolase family 16 protein [Rhodopirellula sp. P2]WDQ14731.1 glycoside hydrolase family 16 protein [Rhodopirellula sp. P2]
MCSRPTGVIALALSLLTPVIADDLPKINDQRAHERFEFRLTYDVDFSEPEALDPQTGFLRREDMAVSNNAGQHRQGPGRRHAAWYDKHHDQTASIEDGVLIQRGFVADSDIEGFVSRDAGESPRNFAYLDPDPNDAARGEVNFADFEIHTSWFDTFALKSMNGKQVPVERTDQQVPKDQFWGQPGKTDTASPNVTFEPGTFFEIEVNFEGMEALAHRHSFWLMPASEQSGAYDDDPSNGLEIDIYEHEMVVEKDSPEAESRNNILLMKCIGGKTNPPSTFNELREDGKTSIDVPGINQGWHKIGLLWTEQALIWFVDGQAVVRDSKLVPTVPMYLIVSREANTGAGQSSDHQNLRAEGEQIPVDAGLYGRNVATPQNRDLIKQGRDEVRVRSVRAWTIQPRL